MQTLPDRFRHQSPTNLLVRVRHLADHALALRATVFADRQIAPRKLAQSGSRAIRESRYKAILAADGLDAIPIQRKLERVFRANGRRRRSPLPRE